MNSCLEAFTDRYLAGRSHDPTDLAVWDLVAAGRPAGQVSAWAEPLADFGRPDITPATMRADQHWFVDQALTVLRGC